MTAPVSAPAAAPVAARPARPRTSIGVLDALASSGVIVHQGRCVEVRNRNATCHRCADACTSGAISFEDGCLRVEAERCIACGTCATVCPTCALESAAPSDEELLAGCLEASRACDGRVVIACSTTLVDVANAYDPARVVSVGCLGRVEESLLAALAAAGVTSVTLVGAQCPTCEHGPGREAAEEVVACADAMLAAWGGALAVTFADELPAWALLPEDRRGEAVFDLTHASAPAACDAADAEGVEAAPQGEAPAEEPARPMPPQRVGRDGTLPHHVPTRRGRLLKSLSELGEAPQEPVATRLWGSVFIDTELCGSCRMCAVFCPTGALRKFDDRRTATFGVEHLPGKCVACNCCVDICPQHAVQLVPEVYPTDLAGDHAERFEMRPREIEPGRPDAMEKRMRKVFSASQFVNYA